MSTRGFSAQRTASVEEPINKRTGYRGGSGDAAPAALENSIPYLIGVIANRIAADASASLRRRFGIGFPEWRIIVVLDAEPGATASRVCQLIGMDKAAASRGLRELEERGLVEPTHETAQRRSRAYVLTREAKRLHAQFAPVTRRRVAALTIDLSAAERALLISMLRRLRDRSSNAIPSL